MTHHGAKDKKAVGSTDPDPEHFAGIQMNIKAGPSCCMVRPPAGGGDLSPVHIGSKHTSKRVVDRD